MKLLTFFDNSQVSLSHNKRIIKSKDLSILINAEEALIKAKEHATKYKQEVVEDIENLKRKAELDGFEAGLNKWADQLAFLEKELDQAKANFEASLVPIAVAAVKKIIGKELELNSSIVVDIVSTAMKQVSQYKKIKVFVSPKDFELLENEKQELKKHFDTLDTFSIVPRADVPIGGSVIETEAGIINATVEEQLNSLQRVFLSFVKKNKIEAEAPKEETAEDPESEEESEEVLKEKKTRKPAEKKKSKETK